MNCIKCGHPATSHDSGGCLARDSNGPYGQCACRVREIDMLRQELTQLHSDLEKAEIAIDEVKVILADCPFESWWKVGLWMEKYGGVK